MKTDIERSLLIQIFVVINIIQERINNPKNTYSEELRKEIAHKIKQFYINSDFEIDVLESSLSIFKKFAKIS